MDRIITIDDIARAAGVGKGTVDRVLHSRGRVSAETRARVLRCIEQLDYRPNKTARMLAKTRDYRIAVCFHDKEAEFWQQIRCGVDKASQEYQTMGVQVIPFILPQIDVEEQLKVIRKVIDERYDGLAIVPYFSEEIVRALNEAVEKGVAVVTFNNREQGVHACYVGTDGVQSGRTAGRLMAMLAAQNSRFIVFSPETMMTQLDERLEGFQQVLARCRPDMQCRGIYRFGEDYEGMYEFALRTIQRHEIDAIYATYSAVSVVGDAVRDANCPKTVTVVGHDFTPSIIELIKGGSIDAAVGQDPERQGYASIDKICRKLLADEEIEDEFTKISIAVAENIDYL